MVSTIFVPSNAEKFQEAHDSLDSFTDTLSVGVGGKRTRVNPSTIESIPKGYPSTSVAWINVLRINAQFHTGYMRPVDGQIDSHNAHLDKTNIA